MTPETLFSAAGTTAMLGWAALALAPLSPKWAERVAALAIPVLLSILYAGLALSFLAGAEGGFGSLAEVMRLFTVAEVALAGWVHYLAFDLLVGAWEVRTARREGIPHYLVLPCLALTFLLGPVGFLVFTAIRAARRGAAARA